MEIYTIKNYKEHYPDLKGQSLTDQLIKECLMEYGVDVPQILRTEKGKPYVEFCETYLSVSHSGDYFVCIVADRPVGIDIQLKRDSHSEKIAKRYFTDKEIAYVKEHGVDGFFMLWTRKEAYSKLTGEGIAELMRGNEVLDRKDVEFIDFKIEDGIFGSYCIEKSI